MAKRELSSTLRNLKFMNRAAQKEEKAKKEVEIKDDGNFASPSQTKKWYLLNVGRIDEDNEMVNGRVAGDGCGIGLKVATMNLREDDVATMWA
ncbi:hypothetical protein Scep_005386 [Stephania cephalantha]|uniref:Uncharacterized protein n=1 Tax=Stephania cephalantha TaxID=152367 RepID=A0AAP0PWB8_9MAGN